MSEPTTTAGIVLCGGQSSRMGRPKAWLPVGNETMLGRVVRILGEVVPTIVVVAAPGQEVPPLPDGVTVVRDAEKGRGPLQGLLAGLTALRGSGEVAYLSSCDVPLLLPAFVRRMFELLHTAPPASDPQQAEAEAAKLAPLLSSASLPDVWNPPYEIAVPHVDGFFHPLAAMYRVDLRFRVERLLAENRQRPVHLFEKAKTRIVTADELHVADPGLQTLTNLNTPEDYEQALSVLGLS